MASIIWYFIGFVLCAWATVECQEPPGAGGAGSVPGGANEWKPAGSEARRVVKKVQREIISQAGLAANSALTPTYYRTQLVAGTNYFVKIQVGAKSQNQYVHARIFKSLDGQQHSVTSVQTGQTESSPLSYF